MTIKLEILVDLREREKKLTFNEINNKFNINIKSDKA